MPLVSLRGTLIGIRTPVTYNPNETDATLTLSSGNMVATSSAAGDHGAAAWLARTTGKFYYEQALSSYAGTDTGLGCCKQGASKPNLGALGTLGGMLYASANYWNGSNQGTTSLGTPLANEWIGWALDLTNNLVWCTRDGSAWSYLGSPSGGTGGKAGGWTTGDKVVPAFCITGSGITCTLRTRSVDFAHAVPSGFLPWEP